MKRSLRQRAQQYISQRKKRKELASVVAALAVVVALGTTWMLSLPGITMERDALCGMAEHQHSEACYERTLLCTQEEREPSSVEMRMNACSFTSHEHTSACYNKQGVLACGKSERYFHTHTSACYNAAKQLICPLEENVKHIHTDACYAEERTLTCEQEESAGHQHTEACLTMVRGAEPTCGLEESAGHQHNDACYADVLTCTLTESAGHQHTETCYTAEQALTCAIAEGEGAHHHGDECFEERSTLTCALTEHTHGDACHDAEGNLTCTLAEHAHDAACYKMERVLVCEQQESDGHVHTDDCYEARQVLTCAVSEGEGAHAHDASCYARQLICNVAEGEGAHTHAETCYPLLPQLTCTIAEGEGAHTHTDECYTTEQKAVCDHPELHEHTADCYDADGFVVCGLEELPTHKHSDDCFMTTMLTDLGHQHTDACYEATLICTLPEHTHSETCYAAEEPTEVPSDEQPKPTPPVENEVPGTDAPVTEIPEAETPVTDEPETDTPETDEPTETVMTAMLFGMPVTIIENEPVMLSNDLIDGTLILPRAQIEVESPTNNSNVVYNPEKNEYTCNFNLKFSITPEEAQNNQYFEIAFGDGVIVPSGIFQDGNEQTGTIVVGSETVPALKYRYVKDEDGSYRIVMELDRTIVDALLQKFPNADITGHVQFNGAVGGNKTDNDGNVKFEVIDGVEVTFDGDKIVGNGSTSALGSIGAKKSAAGYDPVTNTLTYKVLVYSHKGTVSDVKLSDVMTLPDGFTMQDVTVTNAQKITYGSYNQSGINSEQDLYDRQESAASGVTITPDKANSSFEINAPKLQENEAYFITYQVKVDGKASQVAMKANNKLTASSDNGGNTKIETTTETDQNMVVTALSKSGKAENGHIVWTLTVNNSKMDIAGGTLTDPMLQNALDGTIKIDPAGGVTMVTDASGTHFEFASTGDGKNNNSYTITYETDMPELGWFDQSVTNDAKLTVGDDEYHGQAIVGPMHDGTIAKALTGTTKDEDANTVVGSFTTSVKLPEAGLQASYVVNGVQKQSVLVDKMGAYRNPYDGTAHAMTAEQANALKTAGITVTYANGTTGKLTLGTDYDIFFHKADRTNSGECDVASPAGTDTYDGYKIVFKHDLEKNPYGGATLTMNYSSTADTTNNEEGKQYYYKNDATLLDRTGYAEFIDYKKPATVQKKDGNGKTGQSETTINPDGTLTWKVLVHGVSKDNTSKIAMTDTLPAGLELDSLVWGFNNENPGNQVNISADGTITDTRSDSWQFEQFGHLSGSVLANGETGQQTLNLQLIKEDGKGYGWPTDENGYFCVKYTCKLSDELKAAIQNGTAEAVQTFANSVTVRLDDEAPSDPVTQTQETTVKKAEEKEVQKGVVWNNGDRIDHMLHYQIALNPGGVDHEGIDRLKLEDELNYTLDMFQKEIALHPGSVKLYRIQLDEHGLPMKDENGKFVKGAALPVSEWKMKIETWTNQGNKSDCFFTINGTKYNFPYDSTQKYSKLTIEIPDAIPLLLEYAYDVDLTIPQEFANLKDNPGLLTQSHNNMQPVDLYNPKLGVYNKATLNGKSDENRSDNEQIKWTTSDQDVGLDSKGYTLVKVDGSDYSVKLQGAEFKLYSIVNDKITDCGRTYVSDATGSLTVLPKASETDPGDGYYFTDDVVYFLEETKAPAGYMLPEATTRFYFYHRSKDGPVLKEPKNADGSAPADLSKKSYSFFCENQKMPDDTPTYLSVRKAWKDAGGGDIADTSTLPDVQFMVYQTTSETQPEVKDDRFVDLTVKLNGNAVYSRQVFKGSKAKVVFTASGSCQYNQPSVSGVNNVTFSAVGTDFKCFETNEFEVNDATTVEVYCWQGDVEKTITASVVSPTLPPAPIPDGATALGPYTLSAAGGWTWDNATAGVNLPKEGYRDGKKVYFTYYVREVGSLAGWTGSVMPDVTLGGETSAAPAGVTLTNARNGEETTELNITKLWKDNKGADLDADTLPDSITVQVWRKADPTDKPVRTVELKKTQGWYANVGYLPKDGQYYVTEINPPAGFAVVCSADADHAVNNGNVTVTNIQQSETTSLTVNKVWRNENDTADLPEAERLTSVQVQLMRRPVSADGMMTEWEPVPGYDAVTLTAPWTYTWNDLVKQSKDEVSGATTEWIYTAVELPESAPGFIAVGDENDDNADTVTLTNIKLPTTAIKVQKVWRQADGLNPQTEGLPESITVQLWYKVDGMPDIPPATEGEPVTLTASDSEPWAHTWNDIPKQQQGDDGAMHDRLYYIEEIDAPFGFTVAYTNNDGVNAGEITVTNTLQETSVKVEKKWTNADGSEFTEGAPETVRVKLMYQLRNPLTNEKIGVPEQYMNALDADGCYTVTTGTPLTIDHLPTTLVVGGKRCVVCYFVEELPESGFDTTYSDNNVDGVTDATEALAITNVRAKGSLNVTKKYQDLTGGALNRAEATTIRFKLKQFTKDAATGAFTELEPLTEVYEITVSAGTAEGAYDIDGLPIKDADGNDIWYQAVEVDDTGAEVYAELDPAEPQKLTGTQEPVQLAIINLETSVSVEKKWQLEGVDMTVGLPESVTLTLRRYKAPVDRDPSAPLASFEDTAFQEELTLTPGEDALWKISRTGLPAKVMEDGKVYEYLYYFTEDNVPLGWQHNGAADVNNAGIASGEATIVNEMITYTLPNTGGAGTLPYTLGGLALMLLACTLLYNQLLRKRRDERS